MMDEELRKTLEEQERQERLKREKTHWFNRCADAKEKLRAILRIVKRE